MLRRRVATRSWVVRMNATKFVTNKLPLTNNLTNGYINYIIQYYQ